MTKFLKILQVVGVLLLGLGVAGAILKSAGLAILMTPGLLIVVVARLALWIGNDAAP